MADVFISYAREDQPFVRRLHEALAQRSRETWVDWQDIPLTAQWWQEIQRGIEAADNFVFVISPDSLSSQVCQDELEHAITHNKRLIPIVRRESTSQRVHEALASHNWLFMRQDDDFDGAFDSLIRALDTDLDYVRRHTRLLVRAREWDERGHDNSLILRGADLQAAEAWLVTSAGKVPEPTALQQAYVFASRRAATARSRTVLAGVTLAGALAVVLAIVAVLQRNEAQAQRELSDVRGTAVAEQASTAVAAEGLAVRRADEAHSLALAFGARQALSANNGDLALALARAANEIENPPSQARATFAQAAYARGARRLFTGVHDDWINAIALDATGTRLLTGSVDGSLALWDTESGALIQQTQFEDFFESDGQRANLAAVNALAFDPSDPTSAAIGSNAIILWDSERWLERRRIELPGALVQSLAYSPDGQLLAAGFSTGDLRIYDISTGQARVSLRAHGDSIDTLAISPDGTQLATGARDAEIHLWDLATGDEIRSWKPTSNEPVEALAFTTDGSQLIVGLNALGMLAYDLETGDEVWRMDDLGQGVPALAVSPDGHWLAYTGFDASVTVTDLATRKARFAFVGHGTRAEAVTFSPDGRLLYTGSLDSTARSWHVFGGALEGFARAYADGASASTLAPLSDGRFLSAGGDADPRVLLWENGTVVREFAGHTASVAALAVSPDERTALSGGFDATLREWDLESGALIQTIPVDGASIVTSISYTADGTQALVSAVDTSGTSSHIYIYHLASAKVAFEQGFDLMLIIRALFMPGETTVVYAGGRLDRSGQGSIAEVDLETSAVSERYANVHEPTIYGLALSPDGRRLASSSEDGLIVVWDTATAQETRRLIGHSDLVRALNFDTSGSLLISAGYDHTARIWDLTNWEELIELQGHTDGVTSGIFLPDGSGVLTSSRDGSIGIWRISFDVDTIRSWIASERYLRELTCAERVQYGVEPCSS
ncbi:MAG: TIR domain-containing protein [Anaerolineae bacterium]|nr:TIR domain-containing protein [Anaerolineae bacterium]